MILQNIFSQRLPKGQMVWCLGLPYTKDAFLSCCGKVVKSDFIDSLESQYNSTDAEILWLYYKQTAKKIEETVCFLRARNVDVIELKSVGQLRKAFSYSTIILTAHHHRFLESLDFLGNTVSIEDFVNAIPKDYEGTVDISSCFSSEFQMKCKQKAMEATYIAVETESSVGLRLFIYKQTIEYLTSHRKCNYLESFRIIVRRIIVKSKQSKQGDCAVFLGGRRPLTNKKESASEVEKCDGEAPERSRIPLNLDDSSDLKESHVSPNVTFLPSGFHQGKETSVLSDIASDTILSATCATAGLVGAVQSGFVGAIAALTGGIGALVGGILGGKKRSIVFSSVFAPSETKRGDYMMIQVYLYKDGEEETVASKAKEVDSSAERRNYTPLSVKLKEEDKVKIALSFLGEYVKIEDSMQELTWQGHFTDCQFAVFVDEAFYASTLLGTVRLSVNGAPVGRMMFKTNVVDNPRQLYSNIDSKQYHKIFISYSHKDEAHVKYLAEAYKAQGVDYFFDRDYLKAGDIYPMKIKQYIDSADLFILCWSKNAKDSEYVTLERHQALALAYPQVDMEQASITIHPISIEPRAEYPQDMKKVYNFEEV